MMRSRVIFLNVVFHASGTLLCMSQPVKTENNVLQNSLDQHSVRLCHDVFSIIVSYVLNQKQTLQAPSFGTIPLGNFDTLEKFDYQLSENWSKPAAPPGDRFPKRLYAFTRGFKDSTTQSSLRVATGSNTKQYCQHFYRIIHDKDELRTGDYCFDGPNEDDVVLVNKNLQHKRNFSSASYLIRLPEILETQNNLYYLSSSIIGHKRCSLALASKKMYAIASIFPRAHRHCRAWLSWFTFDRNGNSSLADQKMLDVPLKKIAFLINSTLMGLTIDGKILLFWRDKNNKIQSSPQKVPYHVVDFAIDPIQKGLAVLALKKNQHTELACADVRHKNSLGHILFQFLECESERISRIFHENSHIRYNDNCTTGGALDSVDTLKFYDTIIYLSNRMFQVFSKARLKKALCSKTN